MASEIFKSIYPAHQDRTFSSLEDLSEFYTSINPDKIELSELLENPMNLGSSSKIKKIQAILKRLGLLTKESNPGILDRLTTEGIKGYQSAVTNELNPDVVKRVIDES
jgi:hypothetical protein